MEHSNDDQTNVCVSLATLAFLWMVGLFFSRELHAQEQAEEPIRSTLVFQGVEREYFVRLPQHFDRKKLYCMLVVVHGGKKAAVRSLL